MFFIQLSSTDLLKAIYGIFSTYMDWKWERKDKGIEGFDKWCKFYDKFWDTKDKQRFPRRIARKSMDLSSKTFWENFT